MSLVVALLVVVSAMVSSSSPSRPRYRLLLGLLYCTTLLHFGDCCGLILVSWAFFFGLDPNCRDGPGQLLSRTRHLVLSKDRLAPCLKSKKPPRPFTDNVVDRKSTRLNSSHVSISYAVFWL